MTSRFRLALTWIVGPLSLALTGCSDSFFSGPLTYVESDRLAIDLKDKPQLAEQVRQGLADLYGPNPQHVKVPVGSGLPGGGVRLANYLDTGGGDFTQFKPIKVQNYTDGQPVGEPVAQRGGFALYREHCLHCHGVSGAGDGPTAPFLYPRPRDYRKGLFKFTSTPTGAKPTRADLRKTIAQGLHGTSMPAFDALMSESDIEQVVDYMIFLAQRGETELSLIDEAAATGELPADVVADVARSVGNKWTIAETQVMNPPIPKPPSTRDSILRGRELFLSRNTTGNKVDCTSCHGPQAIGNGPSFVNVDVFNDVVFGGDPSSMDDRVAQLDPKTQELWKNSLDDWGMPLRPGNLNRGDRTVYKGGRRPIDLYWRIAKGINGAKMPAHYPTLEPERIWDLVNFVLALPGEPELLEGATLPEAPPATAPKIAGR
ncbi:MAG: cytochrome c [Isosphaeraceae bacterium]